MVRVMFKFKFIIKNIFYFSFLMFLFILSIFYSIYFEGSDTPPYDLENNYNSLITIEYLYRNRKYKKSIMLPSYSKVTFYRGKVKIKICKFFPKIVNVI